MSRATAKKKREKSIEELTISWTSKDWLKFLGKLQPYAQRMVLAAMRQQGSERVRCRHRYRQPTKNAANDRVGGLAQSDFYPA